MTRLVAQQPKRLDAPGPADAEFVAQKRRMGASWDAVAAMLGRSTLDVRRVFDPDFPHAAFPQPKVATVGPRTASVTVLGRRVSVAGLSTQEVAVLKALALGEMVTFGALRARVSGDDGEGVSALTVRRLIKRVDEALPEPFRVASSKEGAAIVVRPGEARSGPVARAPVLKLANPFDITLPPVAVAVLKALVVAGGQPVAFGDLCDAPVKYGGERISMDALRARVSAMNAALPPGVKIAAVFRVGYRLIGGERLKMRRGADA